MTEIKIIDEIMGSGKTTAMINMINASKYKKFIFVTPYLDEVQRIIRNCKEKEFCEPKGNGTKLNSIKELIATGKNIVTTHALFGMFDATVIELLKAKSYTLIIDESVETLSQINVGDDMDFITSLIDVENNSTVHWKNKRYKGMFGNYKALADRGELLFFNNTLWRMTQINIFKAFKTIYVLTYMFDGQLLRSYFDYWKLEYTYEHIGNAPKYEYDKLIKICENERMNSIGEDEYALSATWYSQRIKEEDIKKLNKDIYNFFRNIADAKSDDAMWTVFKDLKPKIKTKGYTKGFVSTNERATNEYKNKTACAYLVNRFVNPVVKDFYEKHGIRVNENGMALSEMLQWIWRSAIREGNQIDIYVPSRRMRELLKEWIVVNNGKEIEE